MCNINHAFFCDAILTVAAIMQYSSDACRKYCSICTLTSHFFYATETQLCSKGIIFL